MKTPFLRALAAAATVSLPQAVHADLYAYDGFDYQGVANGATLVGTDPATNSSGSVGLGGAITGANGAGQGGLSNLFQSVGLSFGTLQVRDGSGRYQNAAGAASNMGYKYTGPNAPTGSTLYSSHLVQLRMEKTVNSVISLRFNGTQSGTSTDSFFVGFSDTSNTNSLVATQYGKAADAATTTGSGSLAFGPVYLVISRFTNIGAAGTRTATTWVLNEDQFANYADGGFAETEWDAAVIGTGSSQIIGRAKQTYTAAANYNLITNSGIQFGIGNAGSPGQDVSFDEMRCASTLSEVIPTGPPPEPVPVSLSVTDPIATEPTAASPLIGRVTLNRLDSSTRAVTVNLALTGTATSPFDYSLPTTVTLPTNANSVVIEIQPKPDRKVEPDETVILSLVPGSGYTVDAQNTASVTIQDGPFITYPTQLLNNLSAGIPQKIVVYGTSLTQSGAWSAQMKAALDAAYPGLTTLQNTLGSGRNSKWGVAASNLNSQVLTHAPDTVFIEFAVNDAVIRQGYQDIITPAQARINLNSIITSIKDDLPDCEIILQVMNPVIDVGSGDAGTVRPNLPLCQQTYRDVGKERGLLVIDHMPAWQSLLDQGSSAYTTMVSDGLHPGATGYSTYVTPAILREIGITSHIPSGSVMINATNHRAAEPPTTAGISRSARIAITRGGSTAAPLNVSLTFGGTAVNGTDYGTLPTSATIPAGSSSVTFEMIPTSDTFAEGEETFTVQLSSGAGYTLASPNKASLIIEDRPFDNWRKGKFTLTELNDPLISGDMADPDNDGIRNLIEFFTNRLPKTANATGAVLRGTENISGSDYLTITYDRYPGSKLTGIPQTSGNLTDWNDGPTFIEETILGDTGLLQTIKARSLTPIGSGAEFMRLKVTRDP